MSDGREHAVVQDQRSTASLSSCLASSTVALCESLLTSSPSHVLISHLFSFPHCLSMLGARPSEYNP